MCINCSSIIKFQKLILLISELFIDYQKSFCLNTMDIEEDDSMEIDESIAAAPIIERRTDDFNSANNPLSEKDQATHIVNTLVKLPSDQGMNKTSDSMSKETVNKTNEKVDVVILDDEDDDEPMKKAEGNEHIFLKPTTRKSSVSEIIDLVQKPHNSRCLNPCCEGKSDNCFFAPDFILSFYRVKRSKSHKEEICNNCYQVAVKTYDELCTSVVGGQMMLQVG